MKNTARLLKVIGIQFARVATLLIASSIIAFTLVSVSPIDPVQSYVGAGVSLSPEQRENIAEYWGLNESPAQRYIKWGTAVLKGDFGVSPTYRRPVLDVIQDKFQNSFILMGTAWILSGCLGLTLGILMGVYKNKAPDKIIRTACLTLSSTPTFWLGLLFLMVFALWLGWFPVGMSVPAGLLASEVTWTQRLHHMILPALTLSFSTFANIALHTRQKMVQVLESDYVLFARARGENQWQIVKRHGLRNIILPAITLQFASFSELFGGSVLAEQVFSYPGLGQAAVDAGLKSDVPLLLGITLFSALFVFTGNMIANILYGAVDPKIRENL